MPKSALETVSPSVQSFRLKTERSASVVPEITAVSSQKQDDLSEGTVSRWSKLFSHRMFVFGLMALLAYEVAEISINSYFVNFMTGEGLMSKNTASVVISLALVIFMVGRFVCSWIMRSVRAERMLLFCALGTLFCMVLVMLDLGKVSMVALVLNYLFEAMMFPTIFSLSLRGLGSLTKSASSLLMMTPVGGCGFMLMGLLADSTGSMSLPFIIPLIGYAVVAAFAYRLVRE